MTQLAQHISTFPKVICVGRILSLLVKELDQRSTPGSTAGSGDSNTSRWKIMALSPLAQIAPLLEPSQFKKEVEPIIVRFFASKTRMTRVMVRALHFGKYLLSSTTFRGSISFNALVPTWLGFAKLCEFHSPSGSFAC